MCESVGDAQSAYITKVLANPSLLGASTELTPATRSALDCCQQVIKDYKDTIVGQTFVLDNLVSNEILFTRELACLQNIIDEGSKIV